MKIYSKIRHKNTGFTLLELLITISLISIIALISFNGVSNSIESEQALNAAQQVSYALKKARYYAKTKGVIVKAILPDGSDTFSIEVDGQNILGSGIIDNSNGQLPGKAIILDNTCGDIFFFVDGTPLSFVDPEREPLAELCTITIGNESGKNKILYLHPYSGSISYE